MPDLTEAGKRGGNGAGEKVGAGELSEEEKRRVGEMCRDLAERLKRERFWFVRRVFKDRLTADFGKGCPLRMEQLAEIFENVNVFDRDEEGRAICRCGDSNFLLIVSPFSPEENGGGSFSFCLYQTKDPKEASPKETEGDVMVLEGQYLASKELDLTYSVGAEGSEVTVTENYFELPWVEIDEELF